jgi:hypothetical protein
MEIDNSDVKVTFSFSPRNYFLVYARDDRFPVASNLMVWSLNPRIDMSYAGKEDQVAMPVMYLSEEEAERCKKAGFTWIED